MDDGAPRAVEFLDDDGFDPSRAEGVPGPPRRYVLVGTLLVALAAFGWARSINDSSSGDGGTAPSASASPQPVRAIADPASMADSSFALPGPCPAGAQCFVSAPAAADAALRAAFPGAVLRTAATILANRAGHIDPGLLRRVILAERGQQAIQVRIQAGPPPNSDYPRRPSSPGGTARVTAERLGYAISVVVIGPGATRAAAQATRLADDVRLLATA